MSQKTGTATERKTDGTAYKATTKNIDSKFSETHTNIESDLTEKTLIGGGLPQNINCLQVVVPSLTHRLEANDSDMKSQSEQDELRLKKSDFSEGAARMPTKPDIMLLTGDDNRPESRPESPPNIEVSVTPLDETVPARNLEEQVALAGTSASPKSHETEQLDDANGDMAHRETFGKGDNLKLNLKRGRSPDTDNKMQF